MQFDVHANPLPLARRAFPYVVILQSHLAGTGQTVVVAPIAVQAASAAVTGRFAPIVTVGDQAMVLFTPYLTNLRKSDLKTVIGTLERDRDKISAALDFLFFGF